MNNQTQKQESFVSPFAKRDNLKDQLINKNIEEERKRYAEVEVEHRQK